MAFSVFLEAFESRPAIRSIFGTACLLGLLGAAGCGDKQVTVARLAVAQSASGSVMGAQQPIAGAAVQLYAVGDTGTASPSTPLLSSAALTSSNGDFNFGSYTCPSASTNVYLTAVGGSTAGKSNALNPNFTAMTALGACGDVAGAPHIVVNELSTIAAVYALAPFMKSYSAVGAGPLDAQLLTDAFQTAAQMVNKQTGVVSVSTVTSEQSVSDKMRALANSLTSCVASAGGKAGDGSGCGTLFSLSTQLSTPPADIVAALLNIANNPTAQVDPLFLLGSTNAIFQPSLTAAPVDWKLLPSSPVSPPTFSPAAGTYPPSTAVTLASSSAGAKIYYTTDGSTPSTSSALYSAPVRLAATTTIRAVSVAAGVSSEPVAGTYTIAHPTMSLDPKTVSVAASKTQIFNASVTGTTNTAVKWALNPALGSITPLGLYVAPASISATQAITLTATSVADPTVSAASTITLVAPLGMSVSPLAVTLGPAQTQAFAVTSTVSANKAVTWSVKPAVGSISQNGAYTAPAAITASQTVTVVATSVAEPSVSASAVLTLSPPVTVTLTPATVALGPLQTHDFIAAIAGTTNSAVTWSLNPAVGSISTSGMYTAPASIPSAQVITVTAASVAKPAMSAASTVTLVPPATSSVASATYYMAPNGSDSTGNGTQAKPWLTPNHAGLTCGDTVSAASGTYPTFTLTTTPGCSSHNAVFVKCAVFATCKVNGSQSQGGILVQASYWAVLGWEVTTPHGSSDYAACFQATP
ncbi:MAG: chitobiase/beta-hexosaminidase C-terminal domain-containing protein, partial [Janthinobacterium lividum]